MRLRHLLAVLALVCAAPAYAANSIDWIDSQSLVTDNGMHPGACRTVTFTTANEANESKMLYVGGLAVTVQSDADTNATGGETESASALFACTSATATACAALSLTPGGTNLLDGGASQRGTLTPLSVAGWLYVDPDAATIDANETHEVIVCAGR